MLAPTLARITDSNKSSPLHLATEKGRFEICLKLLSAAPKVCWFKDCHNRIPLHIAVRVGHLEICEKLLLTAPAACLLKDDEGMNPLHIACTEGHDKIARLLLQTCHFLPTDRVSHSDTMWHLCVKHRHLETFKVLVEMLGDDTLDATDENGETIMNLAIRSNQVETVRYLVESNKIKRLTLNSMGKTELQILDQTPMDATSYAQIREMLSRLSPPSTDHQWIDTMMVVAVLTITIAYLTSVNPPGSMCQEGSTTGKAGEAVIAYTHPIIYATLVITNSVAFASAFFMILLIVDGWPSRDKCLLQTASFATCVSLMTLIVSYAISTLSFKHNASISMGMSPIVALVLYMISIPIFYSRKITSRLVNA